MRKTSSRISSYTVRKQTTRHPAADSATGLCALWKLRSANSVRRPASFIIHTAISIWTNVTETAKHRWANGCISPQMKRSCRPAGSFRACRQPFSRGGDLTLTIKSCRSFRTDTTCDFLFFASTPTIDIEPQKARASLPFVWNFQFNSIFNSYFARK